MACCELLSAAHEPKGVRGWSRSRACCLPWGPVVVICPGFNLCPHNPLPLAASLGTYHQEKHAGFELRPLLRLWEEAERGLPCPVAENGIPSPAVGTRAAWSMGSPASPKDLHKPHSHPQAPQQSVPSSLYLRSRHSSPPGKVIPVLRPISKLSMNSSGTSPNLPGV